MEDPGAVAFARLTREQAERLAGLIDESVAYCPPRMGAMREAAGPGFADDELSSLAMLYAGFMRKPRGMTWDEEAARAGLPADKRQLYADMAERVNAKVDAAKLREYSRLRDATVYGHPHIQDIRIFTEFRPISGGDGIAHLVPYLVVDGTVHDPSEGADRQLKLQLNLGTARRLAADIADGADVLDAQIAEMRRKFGEDAVHD